MSQTYMSTASLIPMLSLGLALLVQTGIICFFGGKLSQRMTSAEKRLAEQDVSIEKKIGDQTALITAVAELRIEQTHTNKALDKVCHEMTGVHRQLANIAMNRIGQSGELS